MKFAHLVSFGSLQRVLAISSAALAIGVVGALPAAAATPKLTLSMSQSPANPVPLDSVITYTVNVSNPTTYTRECSWEDFTRPRLLCVRVPNSPDATGVSVQDQLPSGLVIQSVSADRGLSCSFSNSPDPTRSPRVNCSNGSIAAGQTAHIKVVARVPNPYPSVFAGITETPCSVSDGLINATYASAIFYSIIFPQPCWITVN